MIITFIGMSGSGKSYWSKRLSYEQGYRNFYCDDIIESKLREKFPSEIEKGIRGIASWMGHPYEESFAKRQQAYLDAEIAVMGDLLEYVEQLNGAQSAKVILDTSGSVIYTGSAICEKLGQLSTVVYLKIPESDLTRLQEQFLKDPKPVIWGQIFNRLSEETNDQALKRCYPLLLEHRLQQYQHLADVTVEVPMNERNNLTSEDLLSKITDAIR